MMTPDEIEEMIARSAMGDRAAFSQLYDSTSAKLLGVSLRILKDRASAEDCLQETYMKVWYKADTYAVTGQSPMSWLITIARNTAIDRLRARRETDGLDAAERVASREPSPETHAVARSEAQRITSCLDELKDDHGSAVRGAYLEGETYADLAERFDVPLNTMRSWLRRSLIALKECLSR